LARAEVLNVPKLGACLLVAVGLLIGSAHLSQTALNESATVYNIQVQEHSTYHVGALGTWVHNANCCNLVPENVATAPLLKDDLAAAAKPIPLHTSFFLFEINDLEAVL
jgi:hypothetical protein